MRSRLTGFLAPIFLMFLGAFGLTESAVAAVGDPLQVAPLRSTEYPRVHSAVREEITMPDGTKLRADVFRPATADGSPAEGKFPTVVIMNSYHRQVFDAIGAVPLGMARGSAPDPALIRRGYIQVMVDIRGTGTSEGIWATLGAKEEADFPHIFDWIRKQPWSNGRFGATGESYLAINALRSAELDIPGLEAVFLEQPSYDAFRDLINHGGTFELPFTGAWAIATPLASVVPDIGQLYSNPAGALEDMAKSLKSVEDPIQLLQEGFTRTAGPQHDPVHDSAFYDERSPKTKIANVKIPTFVVGGWFDIFQRGEQDIYRELKLPPGKKQLLQGPWFHGTPGVGLGRLGTPPSLGNIMITWFDRWLKDVPNGIDNSGGATTYSMGTAKWSTDKSWPPAAAQYKRVYLTGDQQPTGEAASAGGLSTTAPKTQSKNLISYDHKLQLCNRGFAQWTASIGAVATTPFGLNCSGDARHAQKGAALFTSAPLDSDLRIAGPLSLTVRGSTQGKDGLFVASIADVDPANNEVHSLSTGYLRMDSRAVDPAKSIKAPNGDLVQPFHPLTKGSELPVVAGKPETLNIEIFGVDATIKKGHRLRVIIRSNDSPSHLMVSVNEDFSGEQHVVIDPSSPSFLTLPITGNMPASLSNGPAPSTTNDATVTLPTEADAQRVRDTAWAKVSHAMADLGTSSARSAGALADPNFKHEPFSVTNQMLERPVDEILAAFMTPDMALPPIDWNQK